MSWYCMEVYTSIKTTNNTSLHISAHGYFHTTFSFILGKVPSEPIPFQHCQAWIQLKQLTTTTVTFFSNKLSWKHSFPKSRWKAWNLRHSAFQFAESATYMVNKHAIISKQGVGKINMTWQHAVKCVIKIKTIQPNQKNCAQNQRWMRIGFQQISKNLRSDRVKCQP